MTTFTLKIKCDDPYPDWIAESLKSNTKVHDVEVRGISTGDMFKRCEILNGMIDIYKKKIYDAAYCSDDAVELDKLEEEYEETWERI